MYFSIPAGAAMQEHKPYFVNELQTHTQSVLTPGSEVYPEELARWIWMCIFTGSAGMQLWRWRPFLHGYQATGRGLTLMDGTPNERASAVADLMHTVNTHRELFDSFAAAPADVSILASYDVRLYFDALLKFGDGGYGNTGGSFWAQNTEGWYRLFWDSGIQTQFCDLGEAGAFIPNTPVAVLPSAIRLSPAEAEGLMRYVESGGILIADGRMGTLDDKACVPSEGIPGKRLSELFGIVETDVESGRSMRLGETCLKTGFQSQKLKITGENVRVLATMEDGLPAITENRYGKGRAIYCNNFLGLTMRESIDPALRSLLLSLLSDQLTVRADKGEKVHLSRITGDTQDAVLLINFDEKEAAAKLSGLPEGAALTDITGTDSTFVAVVSDGTADISVPAGGYRILTCPKLSQESM